MNQKQKRGVLDDLALAVYEKISHEPTQVQTLMSVLTRREKIAIGRRLLIAQAILGGKTRMEIQSELGISPNTFTQVNRWLRSEFVTYQAFSVTHPITSARSKRSKHIQPFSYEHLKRSYPMHFLLFTIAEEIWKKAQT